MSSVSGRRIAAVDWEPLDLELTESFAIAGGAQSRVENAIVRVRLDDGTVGLGEAAPFEAVSGETQASSLAALGRSARDIVGLDVASTRIVAARLAASMGHEVAARCGVEQAVFDALARHAGVPLWALFGGARDELATDMTITAGDVAHARRSARAIAERGIDDIKLKVGAAAPEADAERVAAVHEASPSARILVDANGGYDAEGALAFLAESARRGASIALFEQPVPTGDLEGLARVTREGGVLVCADESARSARDVLELVRRQACGAINIKLMKCGVVEALAMWSVAESAGLERMIGGMVESTLSMTFSAHFAHGLGRFGYVDLDTPLFIRQSPFVGGMLYEGKRIHLDDARPGTGIEQAPRTSI